MNIRRAGRKVVKNLHKEYGIYRIGFVNIYGEEDETELDAMNINDLERLWLSLCPEFECKGNSVCYVERVGSKIQNIAKVPDVIRGKSVL